MRSHRFEATFWEESLYFDRKLDAMSPRQRVLHHISLPEGIKQAIEHVSEPRIIRVFAFSTYVMQPILRALRVRARECALLLYDPDNASIQDEGASRPPDARLPLAPINEWIDMQTEGAINELEIRTHRFYPLEYFILFDDRVLLTGHYLIQDHRFPKCEVQEPLLISDETTEGKILIRKYLEVFESLRNSNVSYPLKCDQGA